MQQGLSYVTNVTIKGGKIALSVLVDDFSPNDFIEISGYATQSGGAFANFYDIKPVPATPDSDGHMYVEVTAVPLPPNAFRKDQDVTVVLRAAKVWLTVLAEQQAQPYEPQAQKADEGTTWNNVRKVSEVHGDPASTQGGSSQQPAVNPPSAT